MELKFVFTIIVLSGLVACNEDKTESHAHSNAHHSVTQSQNERQSQKLVLNDGKKWKLDKATRNNIASIKQTVQKVSSLGERDYTKITTNLENGASQMVSQCKMTGKDHEMLHVWLQDFLSSLKELKQSSQTEQPILFEKIEKHVNEFDNFFE